MSRWQKETFENTVPCDTHVVIQVTKERTSFCEGVFTVCHPGRRGTRQWKCSTRNRGARTIFIHPRLPPSLTSQAWNDQNIKCTWFYSISAGSRWGTTVTSLLRKFLQRLIMTGQLTVPFCAAPVIKSSTEDRRRTNLGEFLPFIHIPSSTKTSFTVAPSP